jgi:hypothetical protein
MKTVKNILIPMKSIFGYAMIATNSPAQNAMPETINNAGLTSLKICMTK